MKLIHNNSKPAGIIVAGSSLVKVAAQEFFHIVLPLDGFAILQS